MKVRREGWPVSRKLIESAVASTTVLRCIGRSLSAVAVLCDESDPLRLRRSTISVASMDFVHDTLSNSRDAEGC